MKKIGLVLFILLLINPLYTQQTLALSCAVMYSIPEAYRKYDGVVIGQVESVKEKRENNQVKLSIKRSFKGITEEKLVIVEDKTWGLYRDQAFLMKSICSFLLTKRGKVGRIRYVHQRRRLPLLLAMNPPFSIIEK
ncbi:hypothetical protein RE628_24855 [Paenibacillus sp. D2_2]|uniref:hypothetical protein n=1 Tax=Paenibacillus sp. D2_2 TaxID=3073092 RepID=UPI0028162194|nr:hypothetical protein [Paenibacillus sp. D2_2]WMT40400.1 hypothetical protein RE628_24855 [Paenibacillus sp. D2_2]